MIDPDTLPLAGHALISDTSSGALVSADATLDWWCPGRFDAPASLYRLIDPVRGGAVRVGPSRATPGVQAYDERTNLVRTRLPATDGEVEVADFMAWPGGTERPPGRIVRLVRALRGPVEVTVEVVPGHRFGPARDVAAWSEGMAFDGVAVRCGVEPVPVPIDRDRVSWVATTTLAPGERLVVTLDDQRDDHHRPLSPDAAAGLADATADAWRRYLEPVGYDGPYRAAVERSLLAIKALRWYATGGLVAAPTASLPLVSGGERNFDGRVAPIAAACAGAGVARACGLVEDAEAAERWLRTVIEDVELPLPPLADIEGAPAPPEEELALPGRRRSQPVRVGAWGLDQEEREGAVSLDHLGDVVAAVAAAVAGPGSGGPLTAVWDDLYRITDWLAEHWLDADRGVWQVRSEPQVFVASRVQCWFALDRMVDLARARNPLELSVIGWQEAARSILAWLEGDGLGGDRAGRGDRAGGGLRRNLSDDGPDAALLRCAWRGPWPADHPIVTRTVDRVLTQLANGPYLYRYPAEVDDGLPGPMGPDLLASCWAVKALATSGRWDAAHERMEVLCTAAPLGLLGEAIDPLTGDLLGNYPSTPVHLALVDAALTLQAGPR